MKKISAILLLSVFLFSCSENTEKNEPAFQAEQDGEFWRALDSRATLTTNGMLKIKAFTGVEEVEINIPNTAQGVYELGESNPAYATYSYNSNDLNVFYTTQNQENAVGEVEIKENNIAKDGTITGFFKFRAIKTEGSSFVPEGAMKTFSKGWFYKVPVTSISE